MVGTVLAASRLIGIAVATVEQILQNDKTVSRDVAWNLVQPLLTEIFNSEMVFNYERQIWVTVEVHRRLKEILPQHESSSVVSRETNGGINEPRA